MRASLQPSEAAEPRPLIVVGDAFVDLSARVPVFPAEGTDAQADRFLWSSGGSASNVAVVLAMLGSRVRLLARVGDDPAAAIALRAASRAGVDLSLVQRDAEEATGLCFVVVSPGGERTFFSARGANRNLALPAEADALLAGCGALHLSGYSLLGGTHRETALALVDAATAAGVAVSLDLCLPLVETRREELLSLVPRLSIVFGNALEVAALAGEDPSGSPAPALVTLGVPVVVVKAGGEGCLVVGSGGSVAVAGYAVEAVDTTGCGDAFVAGFLHARSRGAALPMCGALGNALGALAATEPGSGDALPALDRVRTFVARTAEAAELAALLPAADGGEPPGSRRRDTTKDEERDEVARWTT